MKSKHRSPFLFSKMPIESPKLYWSLSLSAMKLSLIYSAAAADDDDLVGVEIVLGR